MRLDPMNLDDFISTHPQAWERMLGAHADRRRRPHAPDAGARIDGMVEMVSTVAGLDLDTIERRLRLDTLQRGGGPIDRLAELSQAEELDPIALINALDGSHVVTGADLVELCDRLEVCPTHHVDINICLDDEATGCDAAR